MPAHGDLLEGSRIRGQEVMQIVKVLPNDGLLAHRTRSRLPRWLTRDSRLDGGSADIDTRQKQPKEEQSMVRLRIRGQVMRSARSVVSFDPLTPSLSTFDLIAYDLALHGLGPAAHAHLRLLPQAVESERTSLDGETPPNM